MPTALLLSALSRHKMRYSRTDPAVHGWLPVLCQMLPVQCQCWSSKITRLILPFKNFRTSSVLGRWSAVAPTGLTQTKIKQSSSKAVVVAFLEHGLLTALYDGACEPRKKETRGFWLRQYWRRPPRSGIASSPETWRKDVCPHLPTGSDGQTKSRSHQKVLQCWSKKDWKWEEMTFLVDEKMKKSKGMR